jgi:hypothetical protein
LAIPAFLPATVCTGYLAAWFTDLHGFRRLSLVEQLFWSVPLSLGISTIAAVLVARFISLAAVAALFLACGVLWLVVFTREWLRPRRDAQKPEIGRREIGWRPLGGTALALALIWIAVAILSLVDWQSGHQLFMSIATYDHAARVNWTESILRTGVPPDNPLYWYQHAAPMRYYYFWNVVCAAVVRMSRLSTRGVFIASCVWAGFALAALIGLYLKHFLAAGARLRRQFLLCIALLMVTGLDICVNLWNLFYLHRPLPDDLEWWSASQITSWLDALLWTPHHIASSLCCMLAFLLAWMAGDNGKRDGVASVVLIAFALASAFGLSIYVAFGFFLVMLVWGVWQVLVERKFRSALLLAAGGAGAVVLLIPYLRELTAHSSSGLEGGSIFAFAIREMFPPDGLLATHFFAQFAASHATAARNLANLALLVPGYVVELGFYLAVFLIYLVPAWRGRTPLSAAQRALVVIAVSTLAIVSVIRSGVLTSNDFGWRAVLLLQFPLLLFASEIMTGWKLAERKDTAPADWAGLPRNTPHWLRSITALALIVGVVSTVSQALLLRFDIPLAEVRLRTIHDPRAGEIPHNLYISTIGYAQLDGSIPRDAIVQFNPAVDDYARSADLLGIDHQMAIVADRPFCGAELGGDPGGCLAMAAAIDSLFNGAGAEQARATCHQYGIQYLVARVYNPAWKDPSGWVWNLPPVVADEDFRAVDCWQ